MSRREHIHDVFICYYYGTRDQLYCGNDIAGDLTNVLKEAGLNVYRDFDNNIGNYNIEVEKAFRNSLIKVMVLTTAYIEKCEENETEQQKQFLAATEYSSDYIIPILYEADLSDKNKWPEGIIKNYFSEKIYYNFTNAVTKGRNLPLAISEINRMKDKFISLTANPLIRFQYEHALLPRNNPLSFDCFLSHTWTNDCHEKVKDIKRDLEREGLRAWIDDEYVLENINEDITNGLISSSVILIFITGDYLSRITNRDSGIFQELNFALKVKKVNSIIPVVLDQESLAISYWPTELNALRQIIFVNFSSVEERRRNMTKLCTRIRRRLPAGR